MDVMESGKKMMAGKEEKNCLNIFYNRQCAPYSKHSVYKIHLSIVTFIETH